MNYRTRLLLDCLAHPEKEREYNKALAFLFGSDESELVKAVNNVVFLSPWFGSLGRDQKQTVVRMLLTELNQSFEKNNYEALRGAGSLFSYVRTSAYNASNKRPFLTEVEQALGINLLPKGNALGERIRIQSMEEIEKQLRDDQVVDGWEFPAPGGPAAKESDVEAVPDVLPVEKAWQTEEMEKIDRGLKEEEREMLLAMRAEFADNLIQNNPQTQALFDKYNLSKEQGQNHRRRAKLAALAIGAPLMRERYIQLFNKYKDVVCFLYGKKRLPDPERQKKEISLLENVLLNKMQRLTKDEAGILSTFLKAVEEWKENAGRSPQETEEDQRLLQEDREKEKAAKDAALREEAVRKEMKGIGTLRKILDRLQGDSVIFSMLDPYLSNGDYPGADLMRRFFIGKESIESLAASKCGEVLLRFADGREKVVSPQFAVKQELAERVYRIQAQVKDKMIDKLVERIYKEVVNSKER